MATCTSCGSWIPEGQGKSCSMCYGDIDYGKDGYYRREMEREQERHEEQRRQEQQQEDEQPKGNER